MDHTFTIYNFGCKVNQEEGGALAALFIAAGWRYVPEDQPAELVIVNTCTVTATADKKVRNLLRRLRREQPDCLLAACGCYAQRDPDALTALGVRDCGRGGRPPQLAGAGNRLPRNAARPIQMVGEIANAHGFQTIAPRSRQQRARAYLKVEDGCDRFFATTASSPMYGARSARSPWTRRWRRPSCCWKPATRNWSSPASTSAPMARTYRPDRTCPISWKPSAPDQG